MDMQGKGIAIHLPADAEGMPVPAVSTPADGDERKRAAHLIETVEVKTGKPGRPPKKIKRTAGGKGHDSQQVRDFLPSEGIAPQIPGAEPRRGRPALMSAPRFQIERTFSWLQRKFRRHAVRRERPAKMLRSVSPARHHCSLDAAINGIGSDSQQA